MPIITLTTDFGHHGSYLGQMRAVLLRDTVDVTLVDISHNVPPQDVVCGALWIAEAVPWFPDQTVHLGVVDPGVGTERPIICGRLEAGGPHGPPKQHWFVGPDNGLFSRLPMSDVHRVRYEQFCDDETLSQTFHGRDVMAPVAKCLAIGLPLAELGDPYANPVRLKLPEPVRQDAMIRGEVLYVDSFGNLVTNIRREDLPESMRIDQCRIIESEAAWVGTYDEADSGALVCLIGSSGRIEFAVNGGSAAERLDGAAGTRVTLTLDEH